MFQSLNTSPVRTVSQIIASILTNAALKGPAFVLEAQRKIDEIRDRVKLMAEEDAYKIALADKGYLLQTSRTVRAINLLSEMEGRSGLMVDNTVAPTHEMYVDIHAESLLRNKALRDFKAGQTGASLPEGIVMPTHDAYIEQRVDARRMQIEEFAALAENRAAAGEAFTSNHPAYYEILKCGSDLQRALTAFNTSALYSGHSDAEAQPVAAATPVEPDVSVDMDLYDRVIAPAPKCNLH